MNLILDITIKDFLFNVFCNLIASSLFVAILYFSFAPKLKISEYIVFDPNYKGENRFIFKIVNPNLFSLFDIKFTLSAKTVTPYDYKGNLNTIITNIPLVVSELKVIPSGKSFQKNRLAEYAVLIHTREDLKSILLNDFYLLELIVDVTHPVSLSGSSRKLFSRSFYNVSCIQSEKRFIHGKSIEVT